MDRDSTPAEKLIASLVDAQRGLHAANLQIMCAIEELACTAFSRPTDSRPTGEVVAAMLAKALEMNTDFTSGTARALKHVANMVELGENKW